MDTPNSFPDVPDTVFEMFTEWEGPRTDTRVLTPDKREMALNIALDYSPPLVHGEAYTRGPQRLTTITDTGHHAWRLWKLRPNVEQKSDPAAIRTGDTHVTVNQSNQSNQWNVTTTAAESDPASSAGKGADTDGGKKPLSPAMQENVNLWLTWERCGERFGGRYSRFFAFLKDTGNKRKDLKKVSSLRQAVRKGKKLHSHGYRGEPLQVPE